MVTVERAAMTREEARRRTATAPTPMTTKTATTSTAATADDHPGVVSGRASGATTPSLSTRAAMAGGAGGGADRAGGSKMAVCEECY